MNPSSLLASDPRVLRLIDSYNWVDLKMNNVVRVVFLSLALALVALGAREARSAWSDADARAHAARALRGEMEGDAIVLVQALAGSRLARPLYCYLGPALVALGLALRSTRARARMKDRRNHELWAPLVERGARVVWIYPNVQRTEIEFQTSFGSKLGTRHERHYGVTLAYDDGQTYPLWFNEPSDQHAHLRLLSEIYPRARVGYSPENASLFEANPLAMRAPVEAYR